MDRHYQLSLLCLTHLLVCADGVVDENEHDAIRLIRQKENIAADIFEEFEALIVKYKERELFELGIELINRCTRDEKVNIFVLLYKLSEVDGRVHVGEIRLLLYSIKYADIDFDEVVNAARATPAL